MQSLLRRRAGGQALRCMKTDAKTDVLDRWLQEWVAVPPVVALEGDSLPTALSWLRRRGPPLPEAALQKLLRSTTIRQYNPATQQVTRASKAKPLPVGTTLLLPKSALKPTACSSAALQAPGKGALQLTGRQRQAAEAWARQLRAGLLHHDIDFLAVSKPACLPCQGGRGVQHSVDSVMAAAFADLAGLDSHQLRLVHRLDRGTTGALLLAAGPDAAAWLSAAFRDSSNSSSLRRCRGGSGTAASIEKTYWAVVELPATSHKLPPAGIIDIAVPSSKQLAAPSQPAAAHDGQAALTRYRMLQRSERLTWLELRPQTGRKHQLRFHCALGLGAAILGDQRYRPWRAAEGAAPRSVQDCDQQQQQYHGATARRSRHAPLFLHCRRLVIHKPGTRGSIDITAPLPSSWLALLDSQGWRPPSE